MSVDGDLQDRPPWGEGQIISGRYRTEEILGAGGMAFVYKAHDEALDRPVALKVLRSSMNDRIARFHLEARTASKLIHPAVVNVYGIGRAETGHAYLALEFIQGETLSKKIRREGRIDPYHAAEMLLPVCGALAEAHFHGIIHRDLKPENMLVCNAPGLTDQVRLLDFGIAKIEAVRGERLTKTGEIFGTPEYMAPEQALGQRVRPETDVWAMGAVLYHMLHGKPPFAAPNLPAVLYALVNDPTPSMPAHVPPGLQKVVGACLLKDPAQRPRDAGQLVEQLEAFLSARPAPSVPTTEPPLEGAATSTPPAAEPPPAAEFRTDRVSTDQRPLPSPRRPWLWPASGALAGLVVALGGLWLGGGDAPQDPAPDPAPAGKPTPREADRLLQRGDPSGALALLERSKGASADDARVKGMARIALGETKAGLAELTRAVKLDPSLAKHPGVREAVLVSLGRAAGEGAIALAGGPLFPHVKDDLLALAGSGRYEARWAAVKAIERGRGDLSAAKLAAYRRDLEVKRDDRGGKALSDEVFDAALEKRTEAIIRCVAAARGRAPVSGDIRVELVVNRRGKVSASRVRAASYLHDRGILGCLQRELAALKLPRGARPRIFKRAFSLEAWETAQKSDREERIRKLTRDLKGEGTPRSLKRRRRARYRPPEYK